MNGVLVEDEGRLAVQPVPEPKGYWQLYGLHCGDSLAVWDQATGTYRPGRIEHAPGEGWYWTDDEFTKPLRPGLRVRGWVSR